MIAAHITQIVLYLPMDISDPNSLSGKLNHEITQAKAVVTTASGLIVLFWFLRRVISTGFAFAGAVIAALVGMFIYYMVSNGFKDGQELIDNELDSIQRIEPEARPGPADQGNDWNSRSRISVKIHR